MQPELTGMPLQAAEALLREAGIEYILRRTSTPFAHASAQKKNNCDYAVRFDQGELTYASFPVLSVKDEPQEGTR